MSEPVPGTDGPRPSPEVTPVPTNVTTTVEILSMPGGGVLRVTFKLVTGQTVLFFTPDDAQMVADLLSSRATMAGRALLLPPGTVMPVPDNPEEN